MILDKQQVLDAVLDGIDTDDTDDTTSAAAQLAWQLTQTGLTRIDTPTARTSRASRRQEAHSLVAAPRSLYRTGAGTSTSASTGNS